MAKKKKEEKPIALVKHKPSVKNKVAKAIVGVVPKQTIGGFYDEAAEEKLKKEKK